MAYKYLQNVFWGNSIQAYITTSIVFIVSILILKIFKYVIIAKLKKLAKKTKTEWDDFFIATLDDIHWSVYVLISLWFSLKYLTVHTVVDKVVYIMLNTILVFYVVVAITKGITKILKNIVNKKKDNEEDYASMQLMGSFIKAAIWIVAILLVLSNLGYNISTLIAGLGISGIAIAFALQNILSDIFASFSIHFDKPFKVGDFIIIGNDNGVVKKIGIKSTRITTLQGQELVVSNKELTSARINNYKKMEKRRVVFNIGVTYQTPENKLKQIPKWITDIITKSKNSEPSRVHFKSFGPSSLDFEIVYYMLVSDYNKYMDTQQEINLEIVKKFEQEKIGIAYPTQTIFLEK